VDHSAHGLRQRRCIGRSLAASSGSWIDLCLRLLEMVMGTTAQTKMPKLIVVIGFDPDGGGELQPCQYRIDKPSELTYTICVP
jgi:hypothetical protein